MPTELTVFKPAGVVRVLPDNDQWKNRFQIKSSTRDVLYKVAQHKTKLHWACECPGWVRHRKCQHLIEMGLPCFEKPFPVNAILMAAK